MSLEKMEGFCPECEEKLEVPGELEEFSCLYCGARMKRGALLPSRKTRVPEAVKTAADSTEHLTQGVAGLVRGVTQYPGAMNHLTKSGFEPFFKTYEEENKDAVYALELAAGQENHAQTAAEAAEGLLRELGSYLEKHRKALSSRSAEIEDVKFNLCLFLIPMIRKQQLPISEPLAAAIHDQWHKVYPKHIFQLTSYEEITQGFRRKGLCFITSAVCESMDKADNCPELTAFRAFRDGYLVQCPDGERLVREYYNVAPGIVTAIRAAGEPREFQRIWKEYLAPCYAAIQAGENAACKKTYTQMVQALEKKYLKM